MIRDMGLNLSTIQYSGLNQGWQSAYKKFGNNPPASASILEFMGSFKKGSKKFREILMYNSKPVKLNQLQQVKTFKKITGTAEISEARLQGMHSMWNGHFLDSKTKDFLFKYYNNMLGTNQRVNKFNPEIDPSCTFCNLKNLLPAPLETFEHIFYNCPAVQKIISEFFSKYLNIPLVSSSIFFSGIITEYECKNAAFQLCMDTLRYTIWLYKLEKKSLSGPQVLNEVNRKFEYIFKMSHKTKINFSKCNFFRGNEQQRHGE